MSLDFDSARLHNPNLTEDHEAWRSQLRKFLDTEVAPYFDDWDEAGKIPDEMWKKAADIGLLQLGYPEEYGGISEGIDLYHGQIVNEELGRIGSAGGIASTLLVHGIGLPPVVNFSQEHIKQDVVPKVLSGEKRISLGITEPGGGSDVANIKTTARREGDYYIVNGSKTFISGGMGADWISTAVRTGDEGPMGVSMLLVPTHLEGVSRTPLDRKQGWWCSDTATIYYDNVKVPADHLIGEEGHGFLVIMNNFNSERMAMIVNMEACARCCLDEAVSWAKDRMTFGKPLSKHQVIRHKISEMKQRINATQAYIQFVTRELMEGRGDFGDIALLKVQASETMEFCAKEASQILGGASYLRGCKTERIYREVRVNAIGGGSEEIMRDLASRQYQL
ncbi:acyl-CoA dehydrogenase family protein [Pseudoteredinibacter isoporae]|uniref:Acyl-CoA dehydrogenase n=1 Tax=Pseudoteredinibacter isoporae TaxID=570281 RepID=A0A7X0JWA2_9GAMM|nr:acyl-CoA dehydrogenase family protein [Pseudoteredinibacter isoporae]MBB6522685.1 acyl-CoA dehydrogenase [Pseudoteredinibacter isoporae]NHO88216.1 acyl-CoA dehydrogenase [Pseudoteredinibacter isoporae]NIB23453.1 acyl-CoA dehydrogenase [Pseudoteredinibacter isoporae]